MEENINTIISMLESEKTLLEAKKNKNIAEIWKCDLLIQYYIDIKANLLTTINEKQKSLNGYNDIINIFDKIPSALLDKFQSFAKENSIVEKALELESEISDLQADENDIKRKILQIKRRKNKLIKKNENIENKILFIEQKLGEPINLIDENSISKKLSRTTSKHKK